MADPAPPAIDPTAARQTLQALRDNLCGVILGKAEVIEQVLVALCSGGNILLEDVPGVGKTTLAKALARSLRAEYRRIQFTPDLLPADILGGSVFKPQTGEFSFRPGPVFTNILLADEINRASPRTQSALLEAMTEGQATVEGVSRPLPRPFLVIATQNPIEYHGTYPLPEAQLDRFLIRLEIGYPSEAEELKILYAQQEAEPLEQLQPVADAGALLAIQQQVRRVTVEESVATYLVAVVRAARQDERLRLGPSPRAALMLFRAAQARAFLDLRTFVIPDDLKQLAVPVLAHRVILDAKARYGGAAKANVIREILDAVPVPV